MPGRARLVSLSHMVRGVVVCRHELVYYDTTKACRLCDSNRSIERRLYKQHNSGDSYPVILAARDAGTVQCKLFTHFRLADGRNMSPLADEHHVLHSLVFLSQALPPYYPCECERMRLPLGQTLVMLFAPRLVPRPSRLSVCRLQH